MKICQQFISRKKDIILTLLNPNDCNFIISSAAKKDLEYLFSVPHKSGSISDVIKDEMSWTYCYLISNQSSNYGMIKVVPEMDGVLSFHGIGWSKNFSFSRAYFNAWWLIHDFYFKNNLIAKSNCMLSNHRAIKVLINTGYNPDFIIHLDSNTYKVGYHLTKELFYKNSLRYLSDNYLVENKKYIGVQKQIVNKRESQIRIKPVVKPVLLELFNDCVFEMEELRSRFLLDLKKNIYILSYKSVQIKILELFFLHKNQYHIEINKDVRLYDLLIMKMHLRDFFQTRKTGELFVYETYYPILFTNDYLFLGQDPVSKSTIFKININ